MTDSAATTHTLLADQDRTSLAARWRRLEERFVDDPAAAVEQADELARDAIEGLRAVLDERRAGLRTRWTGSDDATTEQLREALHAYRMLLGQLADMPAPTSWHQETAP
ncbi:MAG: hypothetical protein KY460_12210 [Actinobacteria bacterium]|nr:hypothetical protein [Actinomycetota bacterium]